MNSHAPTYAFSSALFLSVIGFFTVSTFYGQSNQQRNAIFSTYKAQKIANLKEDLALDYRLEKQKIAVLAQKNNWQLKEKLPNGTVIELQGVGPDGTPLFYESFATEAGVATRANTLNTDGILGLQLNGEGMQVGVWDAGLAFTSHTEYTSRVLVGDESNTVDPHATRVTGTIIAAGINKAAKGVASNATVSTHDWSRDKIEVMNAAAQGLLLSNHSYGIKADRVPDWYFGAYTQVAKDWDKIMFNAPYYLMVTAAGNAQRSRHNQSPIDGKVSEGYDVLLGFTLSKNGITVAGADTNIDVNGDLKNAEVSAYSSFGPVDDGRIKPDLAGHGTSILSTDSSSSTSYETSAGTSMAAPGVTGTLLLLQQYHEELYGSYVKAATLKGLALHTADDVDQPGPDYRMGWGVMNAKRAANVIVAKDYSTHISEQTLLDGETFQMTFTANGTENLVASISWTDPDSEFVNRGTLNAPTPALANDLDIRITKDGETYFPWKLNPNEVLHAAVKGDNTVDPFEKIEIPNASGTYTITIRHKGTLLNASQDFSLLVSGVQINQCALNAPANIRIEKAHEASSVTIEWDALEEGLFEVQYKKENDLEWKTTYTSNNQQVLEGLLLDTSYVLRIRTFCSENMASEYSAHYSFDFIGSETVLASQGVLGADDEISLRVFPNPVVDQLQITMALSNRAVYQITSTSGVTLKSNAISNAKINVSDLSTGLYILQIEDQGVRKSTKFYKN